MATLLVVDDDAVSRAMLADLLKTQGHTVVFARNGAEAVAQAHERSVDLVILDIVMPGDDGYEVIGALKADPVAGTIPVVVVSSAADVPGIVKAVKLGAADFIFKPFDPVLLKVRVESCLARNRRHHP